MPSIDENEKNWSSYNWLQGGDEWSETWGTTEQMWFRSIFPRIMSYLPAKSILEIAPGFGRCTQFLQSQGQEMWLLDVTQKCLDGCKARFAGLEHLNFVKNDGLSLAALPDNRFDFVFSWDSLVHCDQDVLRSYLSQIRDKMTDDAVGFFHHSNLGALSPKEHKDTLGWRSTNMTADLFVEYCDEFGLECCFQEVIPWSSGAKLTDCISLFTPKGSKYSTPFKRVENHQFTAEMAYSKNLLSGYDIAYQKQQDRLNKTPLTVEFIQSIGTKKVIGWGCGDVFSRSREALPFNLDYLVDSNPKNVGSIKQGVPVKSVDVLLEENSDELFIMVFSDKFHPDIYQWLDQRGFVFKQNYYYFDEEEILQLSQ